MSYEEFEQKIVEKVKGILLEEEYTYTVKPVSKNNGIKLHGLVIGNKVSNISPTLYLEYYYAAYKEGKNIDVLANNIVNQYKKFELDEDYDISSYIEWNKVRPTICYRLINKEKNEELLQTIPYIEYMDLAIVFYSLITTLEAETSSILVRNEHMEHWGVTKEELFEIASENTPKLMGSEIRNLTDIVKELMAGNPLTADIEDEEELYEDSREYPMYVLTNKNKLFGACCMLYKNLLDEFASKMQSDLYIIPSSVHEVLLVPKKEEYDADYLSDLVKQVNSTELDTEDILSDHVYYYSCQEQKILAS